MTDTSDVLNKVRDAVELRAKLLNLIRPYPPFVAGPVLVTLTAEVVVVGYSGRDEDIVEEFRDLVAEMRAALSKERGGNA